MGEHTPSRIPPSRAASVSPQRPILGIGETQLGPWFPADWILPFVVLGSRASRYITKLTADQLVIALTVPTREFAAALIGCGWAAASRFPELAAPDDAARALSTGTPVRVVTDQFVMAAHFTGYQESPNGSVLRLGGQGWQMKHVRAVAPIADGVDWARRKDRIPFAGSLSALTRLDAHWSERLCQPPTDLALVGTAAWLWADLEYCVGRTDLTVNDLGDELRGVLLPKVTDAATWATRIYSTTVFVDQLDDGSLPNELRAVVLDGATAAKCLADVEVPVVFVLVDRSVSDESASDAVLGVFRSRGTPLSLADDLGWQTPAGVEALAFTVPL